MKENVVRQIILRRRRGQEKTHKPQQYTTQTTIIHNLADKRPTARALERKKRAKEKNTQYYIIKRQDTKTSERPTPGEVKQGQ